MASNLERYEMNGKCRWQPTEQNTCMVLLSGNDLSGEVPDLTNLSRQGILNLSLNYLTENLPVSIGGSHVLEE